MRDWLKQIQKNQNYSNSDIARICNIDRTYYHRILTGERTPSVSTAKRIAKYMGFDWRLFFEEDSGEMQRKRVVE